MAHLPGIIPLKAGQVLESAPVLEHIKRALTFTRNDTGKHGLPLLGFANWNDTINLPTGAESLFTAHLYGRALTEFIAPMEHLGQKSVADEYSKAYEETKARVEAAAWEGIGM